MIRSLPLPTLFLLVWVTCLHAAQKPTYYLNPEKSFTQYSYDNWTSSNGLPTNSLLQLYQDSDGYLWMTGYSGLIRFDGLDFKVFNTRNTPEFKSNVIRNIVEDKDGALWLSTQGNGLVAYKNGKFVVHGKEQGLMHLYRGLLADDKGRIWSASPEQGWFFFEKDKFNFINYSSSLKNIEVRSIVQGNKGEIWFATLGEGLFKYENDELVSYKTADGLIDNWVYSLYVDANNTLWVGTGKGLCQYNGHQFVEVLPELNFTINKLLTDRYGNLWIASTNGLYRYDLNAKVLEHFSEENGLSSNYVVDFLFDREGNFWMTHSKGGLSRIKDGKFINYTETGGLPGRLVNTICEIGPKHFLLGLDNGTLAEIVNRKIAPFKLTTDLDDTRIRHILKDAKGNIWISTYIGLLQKKIDGKEVWFDRINKFKDSKIRLTYEDSKGNIWVGTRNSGLIKIDNLGLITTYNVDNGLTSNLIMSIVEDADNNIWVGTSEGKGALNSISKEGVIKSFGEEAGLNCDIIFNLHSDKEGRLWIASTTGLWIYQNAGFYNLNSLNGLEANSVFDVVEDDFGSVWLPYEEGIMRLDKQEIVNFIQTGTGNIKCRVYNKSDGMTTSECNPTAQVLKSKGGRLFFATLDGVSVIDPIDELINNYIPPVVIEAIKTDDKLVDLTSALVFEPGIKRYSITYTAISLYDSQKIKFKYQLVGFEDHWVEVNNQRTVSFTNLPYGDYTFKVTSTNSDGIWSDDFTQISFTVKPRFYETTLFYVLFLIAAITIVYVFYILRITQLKKSKEELEISVSERTREIVKQNRELEQQKQEIQAKNNVLISQKAEIELQAKELQRQKEELNESNKTKDKIFSIISHDLRGPLGNIKNMLALIVLKQNEFDEVKRNRILENLSEITKSTFYLIDNLLNWSRSQRGLVTYDPQMFLVAPLVEDIIELTRPTAIKKGIQVISHLEPSELAFADLNMVKTIFRNFIENALKFTSQQGKIEVSSKLLGDKIEFSIADSGVGMSAETIEKIVHGADIFSTYGTNQEKGSGLGLLICKDFIHQCGGELRINSVLDEGSVFSFTLKRFQL